MIYGVYKVKIRGVLPIYLMLQRNTCISGQGKLLHKFDMKGSTYKRNVIKSNLYQVRQRKGSQKRSIISLIGINNSRTSSMMSQEEEKQ